MTEPLGGRDLVVGARYRSGAYELTEEAIVDFARQWDPQYFHVELRVDAVEIDEERDRADVTTVSELMAGDRVVLRSVTAVVVHA